LKALSAEGSTLDGLNGDDWTSKESLIKANPNWGISVRTMRGLTGQ